MARFQLTEKDDQVFDTEEKVFVSVSDNLGWDRYQQWLVEGNAPDPVVSELDIAKILQTDHLKRQMRKSLALAIGDYGDNIADVTRALVLAEGIRNGSITDKSIIDGYAFYCAAMVEMYGGEKAVLDVLNFDLQGLQTYLAPYYPAKGDISAAADMGAVSTIKIGVSTKKII